MKIHGSCFGVNQGYILFCRSSNLSTCLNQSRPHSSRACNVYLSSGTGFAPSVPIRRQSLIPCTRPFRRAAHIVSKPLLRGIGSRDKTSRNALKVTKNLESLKALTDNLLLMETKYGGSLQTALGEGRWYNMKEVWHFKKQFYLAHSHADEIDCIMQNVVDLQEKFLSRIVKLSNAIKDDRINRPRQTPQNERAGEMADEDMNELLKGSDFILAKMTSKYKKLQGLHQRLQICLKAWVQSRGDIKKMAPEMRETLRVTLRNSMEMLRSQIHMLSPIRNAEDLDPESPGTQDKATVAPHELEGEVGERAKDDSLPVYQEEVEVSLSKDMLSEDLYDQSTQTLLVNLLAPSLGLEEHLDKDLRRRFEFFTQQEAQNQDRQNDWLLQFHLWQFSDLPNPLESGDKDTQWTKETLRSVREVFRTMLTGLDDAEADARLRFQNARIQVEGALKDFDQKMKDIVGLIPTEEFSSTATKKQKIWVKEQQSLKGEGLKYPTAYVPTEESRRNLTRHSLERAKIQDIVQTVLQRMKSKPTRIEKATNSNAQVVEPASEHETGESSEKTWEAGENIKYTEEKVQVMERPDLKDRGAV